MTTDKTAIALAKLAGKGADADLFQAMVLPTFSATRCPSAK